ncbi:hypothetical protein QFZ53_000794 [Microbacterium natoriense]|uniref:DUF4190 domain-containing protein n=1 Tax=Microbacterium natoriense TaxID=284570 RepID=A0AAW8ETP4_9MICO|nr:DUF4190 domain-containing protein [Microbacterium natoriense]MDQ0646598.1 hypothetical protein [Microbacterium natoriense]
MNSLATFSLICGIAGLCLVPVLGPVAALGAGYTARRQIAAHRQHGRRRATAGIALGWIGLVIACIVIILFVIWR